MGWYNYLCDTRTLESFGLGRDGSSDTVPPRSKTAVYGFLSVHLESDPTPEQVAALEAWMAARAEDAFVVMRNTADDADELGEYRLTGELYPGCAPRLR